MIEITAAVALANAGFQALKKGLEAGQELKDMHSSLSQFFEGYDQVAEAKIECETASPAVKFFKGKSIDAQAAEIVLARHNKLSQEKQLREWLIYSGQSEIWHDLVRTRRELTQKRMEAKRALAKRNNDLIDLTIIIIASVAIVTFLVFSATLVSD